MGGGKGEEILTEVEGKEEGGREGGEGGGG